MNGLIEKIRESRKFWYVGENYVTETIGYICPQEDLWWCPSVGYSCSYKTSIFDTEEEALKKLILNLHNQLYDIENALIKAQKQLNNLK